MNRPTSILVAIWCVLAGAAFAQERPVVVELYTSQGCSSCPPADAYLHDELAGREDVIALALHVDYWDYIGWKDIFADPAYTRRQKMYAAAAGNRSVYTPQMIVNGVDHVVGTHPGKVEKLITAHKAKGSDVELKIQRTGKGVRIEARSGVRRPMQIHLVRYKGMEKVAIKRGENAGRVLTYGNIVNDWKMLRDWDGARPLTLETRVTGDAPVVVLVQGAKGGPILAAARLR